MTIEVRTMAPGDESNVISASALFDDPPIRESVTAYLADPTCYLLIAYLDDKPAGFVRGQALRHLDSAPGLILYEIGVAEEHRRQGVATALIEELKRLAREEGYFEIFVLTNQSNEAAMALYESTGGFRDNPDDVMFTYALTS